MTAIFRSRPLAPPWGRLVLSALVAGAAGLMLAVPLSSLGIAVGLSVLASGDATAAEGHVASAMLAMGPFFLCVGFLPGLPLAGWAMRRGTAGWGVAATAGAVIGLAAAALAGAISGPVSTVTFALLGVASGLVFWLALRALVPDAFRAPAV